MDPKENIAAIALSLLPHASILLLTELIAFFFLRQSRATMDEFRHFDSLARHREEVLAILRIEHEQNDQIDLNGAIEKGWIFSQSQKLAAGESTEIVETRKLEKNEVDILNKIVELISGASKR